MENRLMHEKSPYLLQHKDNPVDWYPWCEEAFEKANSEDKPVFLSIGYSTCHWCHVMAHESFEDQKIAALMNDFVCIKVDREERPDIDAVYMAVCQAFTGGGGWPLTVFMTAERIPFFAGTYFPKTGRYGQIGLAELLRQISHLWNSQREQLLKSGDQLILALRQTQTEKSGMPKQALLTQAYRFLAQSFDAQYGGFGSAPKFPTPHNLLFLMRIYEANGDPEALQMVETTLKAMAAGGIFDQIGGGFSRYSTDEKWLIPHFEKMLYDNALLLTAYLEAYQLTQNPLYADIARQTADYILRELTAPSGGFYCGQDADSDGIEGKFYTFMPDEIFHVLGKEDGAEFCRLYNISPAGNFEGKNIPNRIGQNRAGWKADDPRLLKLYQYRKRRTFLHADHKILLSWNAWTIIALTRAGIILDSNRYLSAACKAQDFIQANMIDSENRLYLRFCDGEAAHAGLLDDYAAYTLALTELYRFTFDTKYLHQALFHAKQMTELFEDSEHGGYYLTPHDAEALFLRPKELYDGAIPSGNSTAAMALERLASLTGDPQLRSAADRQHNFMASQIKKHPAGHCFALLAMAHVLYPHKELICTGNNLPRELISYLKSHPAHDLNILFKSSQNAEALSEIVPFINSYPITKNALWYLCENGTCRTPVSKFKMLEL